MTESYVLTDDDHRRLAAVAYNDCWDLLESQRSAEQDRDLIGLALTSRYHWQQAGGGAEEMAIADWMVSRCFAALGAGTLALDFARAALAEQPDDGPPWLQASLHEGLARAYAANGLRAERDVAVSRANELLAQEPDQESRDLIQHQLDTVP